MAEPEEQKDAEGLKEKNGEHPFGDAGQLILLGLFLIVWVGDSFFLHLSTLAADYVPLSVRLALLALSLAAAIYLFSSGHIVVNHHRPTGLVSAGAFRYVRHPLYLGSILGYFGLAASTASLLSLALLAAGCFFYNYIAGYEETLLVNRLGEAYEDYRKTTGKWVPRR